MPSKDRSKPRPNTRLRDPAFVRAALQARLQTRSYRDVADMLKISKTAMGAFIRDVRWMATVALGNGVPIGTLDQNAAKEFIAVWDSVGRAPRRQPYRPMNAELGREIRDTIRLVAHGNGNGK